MILKSPLCLVEEICHPPYNYLAYGNRMLIARYSLLSSIFFGTYNTGPDQSLLLGSIGLCKN